MGQAIALSRLRVLRRPPSRRARTTPMSRDPGGATVAAAPAPTRGAPTAEHRHGSEHARASHAGTDPTANPTSAYPRPARPDPPGGRGRHRRRTVIAPSDPPMPMPTAATARVTTGAQGAHHRFPGAAAGSASALSSPPRRPERRFRRTRPGPTGPDVGPCALAVSDAMSRPAPASASRTPRDTCPSPRPPRAAAPTPGPPACLSRLGTVRPGHAAARRHPPPRCPAP